MLSRVFDCVGILPECQQRKEIAVHQHVSTGWARKMMDYGKMGHGADWQLGKNKEVGRRVGGVAEQDLQFHSITAAQLLLC